MVEGEPLLVDLSGSPLRTTRHDALLRTLVEWISDERVFASMVLELGEDGAQLIGERVAFSVMDEEYGAPRLKEDQVRFLVRTLLLRKGERPGDLPADRESTGRLRKAIVKHERRSGAESWREALGVVRAAERLAREG